ncbi:MAG: hypothetical protein NT039_03790 [Candidatus Berkelbacteria bacterium]|nr:hypothetical protein [Candidatus Berkelbacteria bacterium]
MKMRVTLVLVGLLAFGLTAPSFALDGLNHQILWPASMLLASNDGGQDFAAARAILEQYAGLMNEAVIAPDTNAKLISPPIWPSLFHGHEAMTHVGFGGLERNDSELLIEPYFRMACKKWGNGDIPGALYDLGCGMHIVHDASYCGHSNFLHAASWKGHSAFEDWVRDQTAPGKKPRSFEDLHKDAWVIATGGAYLKESWRDDQGKEHWLGGLEAWVDVAAHLSYDRLQASMIKDHGNSDFQGAAHQQFVTAQRCGAGLLVDFFRRVGVIPEPTIYYPRGGEIWRVRLGDDNPQRLGPKESLCPADFWPVTSPDGKSRLSYGYGVEETARDKRLGVQVGEMGWQWDFPHLDWASAPHELGRAFYVNNFFIAITDAAEGDNWRHLFLLPAVPVPDTQFVSADGQTVYPFYSLNDLWRHHIQRVDLPE